jgi:16S rRNA (adenine1518-N6/adenine1519-N6)-dimethyltransferase
VTSSRRQALGQHFLRDQGIARAIVDLVAPTPRDYVVEIGPGEGALTGELGRRAGKVTALEVDKDLAARLRARSVPNVEILDADARTWDYGTLVRPEGGRVLVVGNLPYSVGKPILEALVTARTAIDEMALMLQKEVADRLAAGPGSKVYGALSVLTQLYCDVRLALRVPPGSFKPPPKVDSAVVHLRVLASPRVPLPDERWFHTVVRASFAHRRKMLVNSLAGSLGRSLDATRAAVAGADIDPQRRAETLSLAEFAALAVAIPT